MTTEMKNLYEDLIQDMIIDGIEGMTPEMKKIIKNAPVDQKREAILSIMEENVPEHTIICSKIRKIVKGNKTGETSHIAGIVNMLREYVKVSATEVKTMGEVMTPIELVEEMLDTLPYEVWTNPNLKWFDPCNGVGTFISVIVKRLMKGLETFQPDAILRYKHIIENMIFTCELQAKNVFLYLYAFDPKDEFALNIYNGSYLDEGFDKHMEFWDVEKFDVIVMNPPYNSGSNNGNAGNSLWDKFVIKTLNQIVEGGYLVAIHPSGWRNIDGKFKNVQTLLKSRQITYLEIHSQEEGVKTFGVETRYDFYCLHNVPNTMFTKIKGQDGIVERVDLSKTEFIPNGMYKEFEKLMPKNGEETVKVLYNRSSYGTDKKHMSKEINEINVFPCAYTVMKGEPKFMYSSINTNGHFGMSKLIWGNGRIKSVGSLVDSNGEYGLTQFCYAIVDTPENLPRIKQAFDNKDFRKLMEFCSVSNMSINYRIIALFRKDFWKEFIY